MLVVDGSNVQNFHLVQEGYTYIEELTSFSQCLNAKLVDKLLKCVSIIFLLNIYVPDSTLSEDDRWAVSK